MDIAADLGSEAKRHSQHVGKSAISGVRDFGTEFIKQLFGGGNSVPANVSDDQLAQMDSNDKAFSDAAYLDTRARIMAIYEEYRMKRLKEEEERREKTVSGFKTGMIASWGRQIRSYVLHPYKLIKDLRTNYEENNVDKVLDGELDGFIEAYLKTQ